MDERIERILSRFDFALVARTMRAMGWTWGRADSPSEDELRTEGRRLLVQLLAQPEDTYSIATGRLHAVRFSPRHLALYFAPVEWGEYAKDE